MPGPKTKQYLRTLQGKEKILKAAECKARWGRRLGWGPGGGARASHGWALQAAAAPTVTQMKNSHQKGMDFNSNPTKKTIMPARSKKG